LDISNSGQPGNRTQDYQQGENGNASSIIADDFTPVRDQDKTDQNTMVLSLRE
jgi:hypothetical protein